MVYSRLVLWVAAVAFSMGKVKWATLLADIPQMTFFLQVRVPGSGLAHYHFAQKCSPSRPFVPI